VTKVVRKSSKFNWIVGGIWVGVVILGLAVIVLTSRFSPLPGLAKSKPTETVKSSATAPLPRNPATVTPSPLSPSLAESLVTPSLIPIDMLTPLPPYVKLITPVEFFEASIVIGYSIGGRPLEVYRFGSGPNAYLVIAGIHGGYEANTVALADELISFLSNRPELIPVDATLYILRSLNPDGLVLAYQKEGRPNMRGVDLNRNFPVDWRQTWPKRGCWDYLDLNSGEHEASEPETIALMAFVLEHPVVALVSYHAAAPGFYPAGDPPDPDSVLLARYLSQASGYPYPAVDVGCRMTGSLVDWVAATGAAAVDLELSNHWDTEFETNLKVVLALLHWRQ